MLWLRNSLMSAPAQNALLPAPVMINARAREFATSSKASLRRRRMPVDRALSASGRLSLSTAQSSRIVSSTDMAGSFLGLLTNGLGRQLATLDHVDELAL